ncbi:MAG TPA: DUF2332 domain-containing protein [Pedococcus sp.]
MNPTRTTTAEEYLRFARVQALGSSPTYERLAGAVALSGPVLDLLESLPPGKRQPNLLLGVARLLGAPLSDPDAFVAWVLDHADAVTGQMRVRSTQTNEAARCATLVPALGGIPGPLALLEVGASAGLCLYPDRYGYDHGGRRWGAPGAAVTLACGVDGDVPLPTRPPEVVWRAGLDLNPLDVTTDDDLRWLEALVWPEHEERRLRLRAAAEVLRAEPPLLVRGDLVEDLPALAALAPADATLVVFHSAVLAYADPQQRRRFAEVVADLPGHWLANEAPAVLEGLVAAPAVAAPRSDSFLLALDGRPLAWTGPHGQRLSWLAG